jgi:hypothetical protein
MKKYGQVVLLALNDVLVNALVVQSVEQADGEHLVVFYLDPAHEATAMGGQSVDAAIKKDFVTPLTDGKKFGWKDLPEPMPPQEPTSDEPSPNLKAAAAIIEQQATLINTHRQKIADLEAELEGVKTELATTTEGIDKQLQGIADATAAKEAAPETTADPTQSTQSADFAEQSSETSDLGAGPDTSAIAKLPPESVASPTEALTAETTLDSEPGTTSDNPLPG